MSKCYLDEKYVVIDKHQQLYALGIMMAVAYDMRHIFYILCIRHRTVTFWLISFATINSSKIISLYSFWTINKNNIYLVYYQIAKKIVIIIKL